MDMSIKLEKVDDSIYCNAIIGETKFENRLFGCGNVDKYLVDRIGFLVNSTVLHAIEKKQQEEAEKSAIKFICEDIRYKPFSEGVYPVYNAEKKEFRLGDFKFCEDERGNLGFVWDHGRKKKPDIKDVIFNDPATIVFWSDGTKTVVKAENEPFDREKGLAMAIAKKHLGNKGNYFEVFKKYLKEGE